MRSGFSAAGELSRETLVERSAAAVAPHLQAHLMPIVRQLLREAPILVHVVRRRKTKLGDHRLSQNRSLSIITVNASGNAWTFFLTLLHELAHAFVAHNFGPQAAPHGVEWKGEFRKLLQDSLPFFPAELRPAVADYARDPLYSSGTHPALVTALRAYDTADHRLTVEELAAGQRFSLNGKVVLEKGKRLRSWYLCKAADGRLFRVAPSARVTVVEENKPA